MTSFTGPMAGLTLFVVAGTAFADEAPRAPRGGHALAADIAALYAVPARRGGHALGADTALLDGPSGRQGGHALDMANFGNTSCNPDGASGCQPVAAAGN